jgi:hypothetical protein
MTTPDERRWLIITPEIQAALLIALLRRAGGTVTLPVAEVLETAGVTWQIEAARDQRAPTAHSSTLSAPRPILLLMTSLAKDPRTSAVFSWRSGVSAKSDEARLLLEALGPAERVVGMASSMKVLAALTATRLLIIWRFSKNVESADRPIQIVSSRHGWASDKLTLAVNGRELTLSGVDDISLAAFEGAAPLSNLPPPSSKVPTAQAVGTSTQGNAIVEPRAAAAGHLKPKLAKVSAEWKPALARISLEVARIEVNGDRGEVVVRSNQPGMPRSPSIRISNHGERLDAFLISVQPAPNIALANSLGLDLDHRGGASATNVHSYYAGRTAARVACELLMAANVHPSSVIATAAVASGTRTDRSRPAPRLIRMARDAETVAAEWMHWFGFNDARVTPVGPDGGIDVVAIKAVAQVKMEGVATGRPVIQALFGVAQADGKTGLFFSLAGYTAGAIEWAERVGLALFAFDLQGEPQPVTSAARSLMNP